MSTNKTREWEERFDKGWATDNPEHPRIAKREAVKAFIHQELQKAREQLLKDIIAHEFTDSWNCEAVYVDTIKRIFKDQSELDQPTV